MRGADAAKRFWNAPGAVVHENSLFRGISSVPSATESQLAAEDAASGLPSAAQMLQQQQSGLTQGELGSTTAAGSMMTLSMKTGTLPRTPEAAEAGSTASTGSAWMQVPNGVGGSRQGSGMLSLRRRGTSGSLSILGAPASPESSQSAREARWRVQGALAYVADNLALVLEGFEEVAVPPEAALQRQRSRGRGHGATAAGAGSRSDAASQIKATLASLVCCQNAQERVHHLQVLKASAGAVKASALRDGGGAFFSLVQMLHMMELAPGVRAAAADVLLELSSYHLKPVASFLLDAMPDHMLLAGTRLERWAAARLASGLLQDAAFQARMASGEEVLLEATVQSMNGSLQYLCELPVAQGHSSSRREAGSPGSTGSGRKGLSLSEDALIATRHQAFLASMVVESCGVVLGAAAQLSRDTQLLLGNLTAVQPLALQFIHADLVLDQEADVVRWKELAVSALAPLCTSLDNLNQLQQQLDRHDATQEMVEWLIDALQHPNCLGSQLEATMKLLEAVVSSKGLLYLTKEHIQTLGRELLGDGAARRGAAASAGSRSRCARVMEHAFLGSDSEVLKLEVLRQLSRHAPPSNDCRSFVRSCLVPYGMNLLCSGSKMQYEVAYYLRKAALQDSLVKQDLLGRGFVPMVLDILRTKHHAVAADVIQDLVLVLGDGATSSQVAVHDICGQLRQLIIHSSSTARAVAALVQLLQDNSAIRDAALVGSLMQQLVEEDLQKAEQQETVLRVLGQLLQGSDGAVHRTILDSGFMPRLIQILASPSASLQAKSAGLAVVCSSSSRLRSVAADWGAIPAVLEVVRDVSEIPPPILRQVVRYLRLMAQTGQYKESLARAGAMPPVLAVFRHISDSLLAGYSTKEGAISVSEEHAAILDECSHLLTLLAAYQRQAHIAAEAEAAEGQGAPFHNHRRKGRALRSFPGSMKKGSSGPAQRPATAGRLTSARSSADSLAAAGERLAAASQSVTEALGRDRCRALAALAQQPGAPRPLRRAVARVEAIGVTPLRPPAVKPVARPSFTRRESASWSLW